MRTPERSLSRRFGLLILAVAVIGASLAFVADRPSVGVDSGYWGALREIGGAIVSGAVLAALVVWFEDRREDERVDRELRRDEERYRIEDFREDEAARKAWRREIDVRLVTVVQTDLSRGRLSIRDDLEADTVSRALTIPPPRHRDWERPFGQSADEVTALLEFLRDPDLSNAWRLWLDAWDDLLSVPAPSISRPKRPTGIFDSQLPARRDPDLHHHAAEAEEAAWGSLLAAIDGYVEANYPTT